MPSAYDWILLSTAMLFFFLLFFLKQELGDVFVKIELLCEARERDRQEIEKLAGREPKPYSCEEEGHVWAVDRDVEDGGVYCLLCGERVKE